MFYLAIISSLDLWSNGLISAAAKGVSEGGTPAYTR